VSGLLIQRITIMEHYWAAGVRPQHTGCHRLWPFIHLTLRIWAARDNKVSYCLFPKKKQHLYIFHIKEHKELHDKFLEQV